MSRLKTVEIEETTGKVKGILESYQSNLGMVPNVFRGMANSPITLQATVTLDRLIGEGTLTGVEQEIVKLVVAQHHDCEYCLAVHTVVGAHKGLSAKQMLDIRRGKTDDTKHQTLLQFTRRMLETNGLVEDSDLASFRANGYTDEQIAEVVTIIGAMTLGCYYNRLNQTELDFPRAPKI
jgi:uncharacterized peroxidase-related enzyme